MKLKDNLMLRELAGQWVVVPLGERLVELNGIITLSESGAFIWKHIESECSEEQLLQMILAEYDIDENTARADLNEFITLLQRKELVV